MASPLVSIIILNWNGYEVTKDCIASLKAVEYDNFKMLVVDNGSKDGSVEKLLCDYSGAIEILALDKNYGFAEGNNRGIDHVRKKCSPDYILLLNNDTVVDKNFLTRMIDAAESEKDAALVVPKIFYYDAPDVLWYAGGYFNRFSGMGEHYGKNKKDDKRYSSRKMISFANGCALLIKESLLKEEKILDDIFFANCEDTDLSVRVVRKNKKIIYEPAAVIWHKVSFSFRKGSGSWIAFYLATRNMIILQKKHAGKSMQLVFMFYMMLRWVLYLEAKHILKGEWKICRAILHGLQDGYSSRLRFVG
ncbi:MAG: glycosyltransferase family 2 protein [Bacillota bacterium]